jgi:ComF family protein
MTFSSFLSSIFPRETELQKALLLLKEKPEMMKSQDHNDIVTCFQYKDPAIKKLITYLKEHRDKEVVSTFAHHCVLAFTKKRKNKILIVPIPARKDKTFDHMKYFAEVLCKKSNNLHVHNVLEWKRHGKKQSLTQSRSERIKNRRDAFICTVPATDSSEVIIIDDVTTSGATLYAAQDALNIAGYKDVTLFAVCR